MIYKIFEQDADTLLELPETGMGYQIVQANQYNRYKSRKFVVYNSNLAIELDEDFDLNKRRIYHSGYKEILKRSSELMLEYDTIKVLDYYQKIELTPEKDALSIIKSSTYGRKTGGKGAIDNPKENASGYETFVRISAYEDDRRIDFEKKRLKPGSFTTTIEDYKSCVENNDDPVDRYALPNDEKIAWSFYIEPKRIDVLQRGIVQPAFDHLGGGIEAYFEKGTSEGTYIRKTNYGKSF